MGKWGRSLAIELGNSCFRVATFLIHEIVLLTLQFPNLALHYLFPLLLGMRTLNYTLYREESDSIAQCLDYHVMPLSNS